MRIDCRGWVSNRDIRAAVGGGMEETKVVAAHWWEGPMPDLFGGHC